MAIFPAGSSQGKETQRIRRGELSANRSVRRRPDMAAAFFFLLWLSYFHLNLIVCCLLDLSPDQLQNLLQDRKEHRPQLVTLPLIISASDTAW